jgi:hypothetical protein
MQILVSFESYLNHQNKYNTTYLDKKNNYNLYSPSKNILKSNKVDEIFDGIKTEYKIKKINSIDYLITFFANSSNQYRLDLLNDLGTYHIAFSLNKYNLDNDEYEKLTELNESKEVFARMAYILKDFSKKKNINKFAIGGTGNPKKDRIYEYIMKYVSNWVKKKDSGYKLGWALYFNM